MGALSLNWKELMRVSKVGSYFACSLVLVVCGGAGRAQVATASAPPADPNQFMRTAADAMSLTGADMKPWHIRAKYKSVNPDGSTRHEGVFEEWWESPSRHRISFTSGTYQQTYYRVGDETLTAGSQDFPPIPANFVSEELLHPLPDAARLDSALYRSKEMKVGANKLNCFPELLKMSLNPQNEYVEFGSFVYCFDGSVPALRLRADSSGGSTSYNGITLIHDHYLARQIRSMNAKGKAGLSIDVDIAEPSLGVDEAFLDPPDDAKPLLHLKTDFSSGDVSGNVVSGDQPIFPHNAAYNIAAHFMIVLLGTVTQDGVVTNLRVVSGPKSLLQPALDTVKNWRYSPFTLGGDPVEVEKKIEVPYGLGPM
jgi:hypothetical protein